MSTGLPPASDRVASMVRLLQLPPFKSLSICPKPGDVKFCPAQFSSLSTHLYVLRMVYKLAGGREVVEFQLILLTNKSPTKPECGVYASQHQLSGKVHAFDSFLQGAAHTKQIFVISSSSTLIRILANFLDDNSRRLFYNP